MVKGRMGLFKVVPHDESRRIFIRAETIAELMVNAKEKLKLKDEKYQLVLQEDGTEIDDDGVLLEMASNSTTTLALMLLPEGISYASRLGEPSTTGASVVVPSSTSGSQDELANDRNLWGAFPSSLLAAAKANKVATDDQRRELVRNICQYVFDILKDPSRGTAIMIAKTICSKYRATFVDSIDGEVIGTGWESLSAQIYSAVHYRKSKERTKRSLPLVHHSDSDDDDDEGHTPRLQPMTHKRDEYGCVEYQPLLPEAETPATQEAKRKQLVALYQAAPDSVEELVTQLMSETYPTQRCVINDCARGKGLTESFFSNWPYLKNAAILVVHAQRLIGIEVEQVWRRSLLEKASKTRKFFKYEYLTRVFTAKKKGVDLPNSFVKDTLKEAKRQSREVTRSQIPMTLVLFPLLVHHFEENQDFLFIVVENDLAMADIVAKVPNAAPTLIIRGLSIYDETASCSVLLEKAFEVPVANVQEGFMVTFLCYFIFGCKYPNELKCTLEYIQRVFLQINPAVGNKQKSKKRKQTTYEPKVLKLIKMIHEATPTDT